MKIITRSVSCSLLTPTIQHTSAAAFTWSNLAVNRIHAWQIHLKKLLFVCVRACACNCMCVYVCTCGRVSVCMCRVIFARANVRVLRTCVYVYVYMCACVCVMCVYRCVCVCMFWYEVRRCFKLLYLDNICFVRGDIIMFFYVRSVQYKVFTLLQNSRLVHVIRLHVIEL